MTRRRATVAIVATAAATCLLAACGGPKRPRAELTAIVPPPAEGAAVLERDIRTAAGSIELILRDLAIERAEVLPTMDGRVRVVLPESQAARVADVRKRIEDSNLGVRIE